MAWIVEQHNGKNFSITTKTLEPKQMKSALSPLAWKILKTLAENPSYPKEIGQKLKMNEQKVYYHIRNLEKAGLIEKIREERKQGALAKVYALTNYAFSVVLKPLEESQKVFQLKREHKEFLEPFIVDGRFNALIIIGSPEPHGQNKSRGKDVFTIDLGLFFGTFLNYIPEFSTKLDTEVSDEDLKNNLVLIGGPGINSITHMVNSKLPITFQRVREKENWYSAFHSNLTGRDYTEEGNAMIVKTKNPFDKTKEILVLAGRRSYGTRSAILAFLKNFDEICRGNSHDRKVFAKVIEGVDKDSDGVIDSIEFLE